LRIVGHSFSYYNVSDDEAAEEGVRFRGNADLADLRGAA
jgi:hypothetical protein